MTKEDDIRANVHLLAKLSTLPAEMAEELGGTMPPGRFFWMDQEHPFLIVSPDDMMSMFKTVVGRVCDIVAAAIIEEAVREGMSDVDEPLS